MFSRIYYYIQRTFGVSTSEARGVFILFLIILVSLITPFALRQFTFDSTQSPLEQQRLDSLVAVMKASFYTPSDTILFRFDPNRISEYSLVLLKFEPRVAKRLVHYREKGGRFHYKEALYKIYGISSGNIHRVYDYISLPDSASYSRHSDKMPNAEGMPRQNPAPKVQLLDINKAKPEDLLPIYGIGQVLATRIVKYRNLLGGFVNKDQFREVYGLGDDALENLRKATFISPGFSPKKIQVNRAGFGDLLRHPYISKALAKEIDTFRKRDGDLKTADALYGFKTADKREIEKLLPYLDFE